MTPPGIKPATFQLVAQCLNRATTPALRHSTYQNRNEKDMFGKI